MLVFQLFSFSMKGSLLRHMKQYLKNVYSFSGKDMFPYVTGKERSIINAIKSEFPGIKLLYY